MHIGNFYRGIQWNHYFSKIFTPSDPKHHFLKGYSNLKGVTIGARARKKFFLNIFVKNSFLVVILCKKSIPHIPKA